jgi:hypothetical protein
MSELAKQLEGFRYETCSEARLQLGIWHALGFLNHPAEREVQVSCGRLDFLTEDGVAIEVKLHGTTNDLLRQLQRYAQLDEVKELLVVTTRHRLAQLPMTLSGKPVSVALLLGSVL